MKLNATKTIYNSNIGGAAITVNKNYWIADNFPLGTEKEIEYEIHYFDAQGNGRAKWTKNGDEAVKIVDELKTEYPAFVGAEYSKKDWEILKKGDNKNAEIQ